MNAQELREKLGDYENSEPLGVISDYIVWQLDRMNNRELAETTAKEILDGKFTVKKALETVVKKAKKRRSGRSAVMTDREVFEAVREYLCIKEAVTEEEAAGFIPESTHVEPVKVSASSIVDFSIFNQGGERQ